jgi:hypothetical protein
MGLGKTYSTQYLADSNNNTGVAGQVLSTTSTGIDWADANTLPGAGLWLENGNDIYNSNSGNVGIGTTSPERLLSLYSDNAETTPRLLIEQDGTGDAVMAFSLTSGQGWSMGIDNSGGDAFMIHNSAGGVDSSSQFVILNSGNVGIGTTSPVAKLHVYQNDTEVDTEAGVTIEQDGTGDAALSFLLTGTKRWKMGIDNNDSDKFKISDSTNLASNNKLTIISSGNVGIGTTSPSQKLEVSGNIQLTNKADSILLGSAGANGTWGAPKISRIDNSIIISDYSGVQLGGYDGSSYGARVTIKGTGNVGIGTTSPGVALDVSGQIRSNDSFLLQSGTTAIGSIRNQGGTLDIRGDSTRDVSLGSVTSPQALFVEGTNGKVGIGTTSPNQKLHVNGGTQLGDINATVNFGTVALKVVEGTVSTGPTLGSGTVGAQAVLYSNGLFGMYTGVSSSGDTWMQSQRNDADTSAYDILLNPLGGNVGIGTTSPAYKLQVGDNGVADGNIAMKANGTGVDAGAELTFNMNVGGGNADSYIAQIVPISYDSLSSGTHNSLNFKVGTWNNNADAGVSRMTILSNGNVGIGTTSPSRDFVVSNGGASGIEIQANYQTGVNEILSFDRTTGATAYETMRFNGGDFEFQIGGTEKMRINSSGNVGIGTTSPQANTSLDVRGNGATSDAAIKAYAYGESGTSILGNGYATSGSGINYGVKGLSTGPRSTVAGSVNVGGYFSASSAETNYALITGTGNVGIGTTSPTSGRKLDVHGDIETTTSLWIGGTSSTEGEHKIKIGQNRSGNGYAYIDLIGDQAAGSFYSLRIIRHNSGVDALSQIVHTGTGNFEIKATSAADIILNSPGNVGISQTSPLYKLDVTGNGRFTSTVTATNFILSSDERLKENIEKACDNRIKADWKTFELKTDKGQKRYGVIAQELEKTNPEFVREDTQGFKSVAYIDLLIAKIAELEARLEKLEK